MQPRITVRWATLSPDQRHRYELYRGWYDPLLNLAPRSCTLILCNPSTADAITDDATVRKSMGFAHRWGYDAVTIYNALALRSRDPKALLTDPDPFGPDNLAYLNLAFVGARGAQTEIVLGWGGCLPEQFRASTIATLRGIQAIHDVPVYCLGLTKDGQPNHPLMLPYETQKQRCGLGLLSGRLLLC